MLLSQFITPLASCCCGCSLTTLCPTLCDPMDCSIAGFPSLLFTNSLSLLKLMSFESVMPSNHFILCHPPSLSLPSPLALNLASYITSICNPFHMG